MRKTERLISLTTQDFEKLKARNSGGMGCFLIVFIVTLLVSAFSYFLLEDLVGGRFVFNGGRINLSIGVIVLPFSFVLIALSYFILGRSKGRTNKDIREGKKRVLTGKVVKLFTEDLDPSRSTNFAITTAYMVDIEGTQYDVKEQEYQQYKEGMLVEVHTAPHSGEFLGIYDASNGKLLTEELL